MPSRDEQLARGWKLHQAGDLAGAAAVYRGVLDEEPNDPNAWCFWGMVCHDTLQFEEALEAYARALELKPDFPIALNNRGNSLRAVGRIAASVASFEAALALQPEYVSAHHNQSLSRLLGGDWERGFAEYEWRWRYLGITEPSFPQPRWDGTPLQGKRILLHAEQGLGDTIQFVRFARQVAERGGRVQLIAQGALLPLLRSMDEMETFTPQGGKLPEFDVHAPLMSLPGILGLRLDDLPPAVPYLAPAPELVEYWARELQSLTRMRVGLAWQGNPENPSDKHRSIGLGALSPLGELPHIDWISLQKGPGVEQLGQWQSATPLRDLGDRLDGAHGAFMDSAAILPHLDLLITSDSALAHLAGALGVPVWCIVPFAPDWRWMLGRDDSPWYPSMRLFRQTAPGNWAEIVRQVRDELARRWHDRNHHRGRYSASRLAATAFNTLNRSRHGLMLYNRHDTYIGRSLDRYGGFSEAEIDLFRQLVRPGDVVVEAGANVGAHTVPLAQLVGERGRVWAYEPQRIVFQTLCANLALNSLTNVMARQAALGAAPGSLLVPQLDYAADNNFGGLGLGEFQRGEAVPVETLDALELPRLNLFKIDVEGMELRVLQGAIRTMETRRPLLYVENDRLERSAELIQFLSALGYRLYWHLPPLYRRDNYFANSINLFGGIVSVNMLGIHASVPANIQGLRPVSGPEDRP